jgi:DNA-binding sugar fermentation-stimulating protein
MENIILHELENVVEGEVAKRPSKTCKTPYVADVIINSEETLGHSPSLGCCGLVEKGSSVIMSLATGTKNKCEYRIDLSIYRELLFPENEIIIGVNPKLGEVLVESALTQNCILGLQHIQSYRREVTYLTSRFDFHGIDQDGREFFMEVKSVPLADYVDVPKKDRKKYTEEIANKKFNEKISYFPDGYRKNSTDVVSPRALKHITELEEIVKTTDKRAILCFVVQRPDVNCFQPSNIDLTYKHAVKTAFEAGVEIKTIQVEWSRDGKCRFIRNDLPINL